MHFAKKQKCYSVLISIPPFSFTQNLSFYYQISASTSNQTNHPNPLRPESFSAAFHNRLLRCCIPAS